MKNNASWLPVAPAQQWECVCPGCVEAVDATETTAIDTVVNLTYSLLDDTLLSLLKPTSPVCLAHTGLVGFFHQMRRALIREIKLSSLLSIPGSATAVPALLAVSSKQKFPGSQKPLFMFRAETTCRATMSPPE